MMFLLIVHLILYVKTAESVVQDLTEVEKCLLSSDCWVKYDFKYDETWNSCYGEKYVRYTGYLVGKIVGAVVCNNTDDIGSRYKIWLSDVLTGTFYNIFDSSGSGHDHCEFVGGSDGDAQLGPSLCKSPAPVPAFSRGFYGSLLTFGSGENGRFWAECVGWYECGVSVPGADKVVKYNGDGSDIRNLTAFIPPVETEARIWYTIDDCSLRQQWKDGPASAQSSSYPYLLSCVRCGDWGTETHVMAAYGAHGSVYNKEGRYSVGTVTITLKVDGPVAGINLVLISYDAVEWNIQMEPRDLSISLSKIIIMSHYSAFSRRFISTTYQSVPVENIQLADIYLGNALSHGSMRTMFTKLKEEGLEMTSFIGMYSPQSYTLTVGRDWNSICSGETSRFVAAPVEHITTMPQASDSAAITRDATKYDISGPDEYESTPPSSVEATSQSATEIIEDGGLTSPLIVVAIVVPVTLLIIVIIVVIFSRCYILHKQQIPAQESGHDNHIEYIDQNDGMNMHVIDNNHIEPAQPPLSHDQLDPVYYDIE